MLEIHSTPAPATPEPAATNLASPTASLELMTMSDHVVGMLALRVFASLANNDHITSLSHHTPSSHQCDPEFFLKSQAKTIKQLVAAHSLQGLPQVPLSSYLERARAHNPKFKAI